MLCRGLRPFPARLHSIEEETHSLVGGDNALYYLIADRLGSTRRILTESGDPVTGSIARYTPFGDWRTEPTANLTDRGFTGHMQENLGSNDLGLIYMQARFFVPALGRFASADTIVPDVANPQQYNRYTYSLNSPIRYTDPSGNCPVCLASLIGLVVDYGWQVRNNVVDNNMPFWDAVYYQNIDWGEVIGVTVGSGIGAGLASPLAGVAAKGGTPLLTQLAWRGAGGALGAMGGGQARILVESHVDELIENGFSYDEISAIERATSSGLLDPKTIFLDGATGVIVASATTPLQSALQPWQSEVPTGRQIKFYYGPGKAPVLEAMSKQVVLTPSQYEALIIALQQGSIDVAENFLVTWLGLEASDYAQD